MIGKPPTGNVTERSDVTSHDSVINDYKRESDYYDDWLRLTKLRLITRPKSIGVFSVEIEGSKFTYTTKQMNGRVKTRKKVTRKFAGTGSSKEEAKMDLFRTIRTYDTCHTPSGNFNTPYYTKG